MWVGKIHQIDREKYKIIHLRQIRQTRSQHYHILNLFILPFMFLILSFFIFYLLSSLSSFNILYFLSSIFIFKYLSFLLNLYLISDLLFPYLLFLNWIFINLNTNKVLVDSTLKLPSTLLLVTNWCTCQSVNSCAKGL